MSNIETLNERVARLCVVVESLSAIVCRITADGTDDERRSEYCRTDAHGIAAECSAVDKGETGVESPTGTWTLTTDPDCPRAWEHRRDDGTVDSLVFSDEVVHMYHAQQGQGFDKGQSIGKAGVDAPPPLASAGDTPAPPTPADDDVETVRKGLARADGDAEGNDQPEVLLAWFALDRLTARLAHLEGQRRLCEIDCANQEARGNDAESRLAQFEALAERAHNALDGDNMIAGVRVLHDLAALRREGV